MARKKEEVKEEVKESSLPTFKKETGWRPYRPGLLIKKVTEEERQKLHDERKIYGWDPKTQEAIIKEVK